MKRQARSNDGFYKILTRERSFVTLEKNHEKTSLFFCQIGNNQEFKNHQKLLKFSEFLKFQKYPNLQKCNIRNNIF